MPLRIEACDFGRSDWNVIRSVLPGEGYVLKQFLPDEEVDGERVYIANCEEGDGRAIIYVSTVPTDEFMKKIHGEEGVHCGEDLTEMVTIRRGETYKMSIKTSDDSPRRLFSFKQE